MRKLLNKKAVGLGLGVVFGIFIFEYLLSDGFDWKRTLIKAILAFIIIIIALPFFSKKNNRT